MDIRVDRKLNFPVNKTDSSLPDQFSFCLDGFAAAQIGGHCLKMPRLAQDRNKEAAVVIVVRQKAQGSVEMQILNSYSLVF